MKYPQADHDNGGQIVDLAKPCVMGVWDCHQWIEYVMPMQR